MPSRHASSSLRLYFLVVTVPSILISHAAGLPSLKRADNYNKRFAVRVVSHTDGLLAKQLTYLLNG